MKKLKVYGVCADGKNRMIVAAKSMNKAAILFKVSYNFLKTYGSITGNKNQIQIATSKPEVVFIAPITGPDREVYKEKI